jgi:hypothetical protein
MEAQIQKNLAQRELLLQLAAEEIKKPSFKKLFIRK